MTDNPERVSDPAPKPSDDPGRVSEPGKPFQVFQTEEDFEKVVSLRAQREQKQAESANKELAKLRAELDGLRKKSETEQEKAVREAREAGAAEAMAIARTASLEGALTALGLEGAKLKAALAAAPDEWENVGSALTAIREGLPELFGSKSKTVDGGGGNAPGGQREPWTSDKLRDALDRMSYEQKVEFWRKHRDEVNADLGRNVMGTMTTVAPGVGLQTTPTVENTRR